MKSHPSLKPRLGALCLSYLTGLIFTLPTFPAYAIVGGETATPGDYPWNVALVFANNPNTYHAQYCGGALIDPQWVVTGAHCAALGELSQTAADIEVVVGRHQLSSNEGQRIPVTQIVLHPAFNPLTYQNDIALLKLASPATATPIALPQSDTSLDDAGVMATLIGWGETYDPDNVPIEQAAPIPGKPDQLREVTLPIISNALCAEHYDGVLYDGLIRREETLFSTMLCAGYPEGGKDSCWGDSGGPLVVQNPSGDWTLIGIVNINGDHSQGGLCAEPSLETMYTRVSAFQDFIQTTLAHSAFELADGGFEYDLNNPAWHQGADHFEKVIVEESPHTGRYHARIGGEEAGTAFVEQFVLIPSEITTLSFWLHIPQASGTGNDMMRITVDGNVLFEVSDTQAANYSQYTPVLLDISEYADGTGHHLRFESDVSGYGLTHFLIDEVTLSRPSAGVFEFIPPTTQDFNEEDESSIRFEVNRTGGSEGEVSVILMSTGSAKGGHFDFFLEQGDNRLNWADGESGIKSLNLTIIDDPYFEIDETITFQLIYAIGGARIGQQYSASVNLSSEDTVIGLMDGGFELGSFIPFTLHHPVWHGNINSMIWGVTPHTGANHLSLADNVIGFRVSKGKSYAEQNLIMPPGITTLSFWLKILTQSGQGHDVLQLQLDGEPLFEVTDADMADYTQYTQVSVDVSAYADAQVHHLNFYSRFSDIGVTTFAIDDVVLSLLPPVLPKPDVSPGTPSCRNRGVIKRDCVIEVDRSVARLNIKSTVYNLGLAANLKIQKGGSVIGGLLSGHIHNKGTLSDFEFRGGSLIGGTLAGMVRNSSEVGGKIIDVNLAPNTRISGGKLKGRIKGDMNEPAFIDNVFIVSGSHLSGVILGTDVVLGNNVTIEP
jgi:hypothetical protein